MRLLRGALLIAGTMYAVVYLVLVALRIRYPFELEWMEGGALDHMLRVLDGKSLYVQPNLEFVPYVYTPLHYWVSAGLARITYPGFFPMRLTSFIASIGSALVIYRMVQRQTGDKVMGIFSATLFLASFRLAGAFFDVARVDSLFVFLFLAAIDLIGFGASTAAWLAAAVLLALAYLTKQTALAMCVPLLAYAIYADRRRGLLLAVVLGVLVAGSTLLLNYRSAGWFSYYVFRIPQSQKLRLLSGTLRFCTTDLLLPLSIACLLSGVFLYTQFRQANPRRWFFAAVAASMIGGSWLGKVHVGGGQNVLIPAYAIVAALAGMGLHSALVWSESIAAPDTSVVAPVLYIACLVQFAALYYNPIAQVPTKADLAAGQKLVARLAAVQGEVWVPAHGYLARLAGKRAYAHASPLSDVISADPAGSQRLQEEMRHAMQSERFAAIVVDPDWPAGDRLRTSGTEAGLAALLPDRNQVVYLDVQREMYYPRCQAAFESPATFTPVVGMRTRPEYICFPP
jgi:4-amino-4-deoxy-L-arabinose transferase-like glycosyltransferase